MTLPKPYYQDDSCTIYHGDCREILPHLEPVDLVLTDPPYSDHTHDKHLSTVAARTALGFCSISIDDLKDIASSLCILSRAWVVLTCDHRHINDLPNLIRFGVWIKPNGSPQFTGDRPGTGWEPIAFLHKPGKKKWNGGGRHAVFTHPIQTGDHPTQKPLKLCVELIGLFSDTHQTILDPFMGSGTTLRAAKDLGRKAIGIEIEEKYCEIAVKRLRQEVLPLRERA